MAQIGGILRSASLVSLGTAGGQLIAFLGSLVTVRLFAPEEFGIFTTMSAVVACLTPLLSGRFDMAVPLPKSDRDGLALATTAALVAFVISAIMSVGMVMYGAFSSDMDGVSPWWWGLPSMAVALTIYQGANQLAVRFGAFRSLALRGLMYPSLMTAVQVVAGLTGAGPEGLVIGLLMGQVVTGLSIWIPLRRRKLSDEEPDAEGGLQRQRRLTGEYRSFPAFLGPSGAMNALGTQLPQIGVTFLFGLSDGGQFGVMMRILAVPVALIGQSLGYVYTSEIARDRRQAEGKVFSTFRSVSLRLALVAALLFLVLITAGPPFLTFVLGEQWSVAGELARYYAIGVAAQLVVAPVSQTLILAGKAKTQLAIDTVRVALIAMVFLAAQVFSWTLFVVVLVVAVVVALSYGFAMIFYRRAASRLDTSVS